jgi:hypothetical protein
MRCSCGRGEHGSVNGGTNGDSPSHTAFCQDWSAPGTASLTQSAPVRPGTGAAPGTAQYGTQAPSSRLPTSREVTHRTNLPNQFKLRLLAGASHMLRKCVQHSSDVKYMAAWAKWCHFLVLFENFDQDSDNTRFMLDKSQRSQLETIGSFLYHGVVDLHLRAATMGGILAGVRHFFRANFLSLDIFAHPSIRSVKHGLALEERAKSDYCAPKKKLPLTASMVKFVLEQARISCSIHIVMVATAIALAFFCLLRVSEYVPKFTTRAATATSPAEYELTEDGDRCHAIMAKDVLYEVASELEGHPAEFIPSFRVKQEMWSRVKVVKITLRSAKNDVMRAGNTFWLTNLETTQYINIVKVLFDWSIRANHRQGDYFMSYNVMAGRSYVNTPLAYNSVNHTVKKCATDHNLDPRDFGTHSARIGGATALRAAGASESMIQRLGRWLSECCAREYPATSFREFDMMQMFLQAADNYTVRDLQLQYTPRV